MFWLWEGEVVAFTMYICFWPRELIYPSWWTDTMIL